MNTLEELKAEINEQVLANHPSIILEALDSLLQEIAGAHADMRSGACSYQVNFNTYRGLKCRITFLGKRMDMWWNDCNMKSIELSIQTIKNNLRSLRMRRYENVCRDCSACKTRRRQWPECTKFTSDTPEPFSLMH